MALVIIVTHYLPKLLPSGLNLAFSCEYLMSHQTFILSDWKNQALLGENNIKPLEANSVSLWVKSKGFRSSFFHPQSTGFK